MEIDSFKKKTNYVRNTKGLFLCVLSQNISPTQKIKTHKKYFHVLLQ